MNKLIKVSDKNNSTLTIINKKFQTEYFLHIQDYWKSDEIYKYNGIIDSEKRALEFV